MQQIVTYPVVLLIIENVRTLKQNNWSQQQNYQILVDKTQFLWVNSNHLPFSTPILKSKMARSIVADMDLVSLPFYVCITQKWCQEYFVGCWTLQTSGVTSDLVHLEDII